MVTVQLPADGSPYALCTRPKNETTFTFQSHVLAYVRFQPPSAPPPPEAPPPPSPPSIDVVLRLFVADVGDALQSRYDDYLGTPLERAVTVLAEGGGAPRVGLAVVLLLLLGCTVCICWEVRAREKIQERMTPIRYRRLRDDTDGQSPTERPAGNPASASPWSTPASSARASARVYLPLATPAKPLHPTKPPPRTGCALVWAYLGAILVKVIDPQYANPLADRVRADSAAYTA